MSADVLGPAVAGSWYPSDRDALAGLVDRLLEKAEGGAARAVIAPHAGYAYSGPLAAAALRALETSGLRRVILLGPSHHHGFAGAAVPRAARACRTPLGDLPIDREAVLSLAEQPGFRADDRVFVREHALESELPFLQRLLAETPAIVPILLGGGATIDDAAAVARAVAPFVDAATRVVVSSDFTHYGTRFDYVPFADAVPERIAALDRGALQAIEAGDATGFARYVDATGATICGRRAIDVLLRLPAGARGGRTVAYDTSGRQTGTWDHSVSYAAVELFP
ncbi:MAG TPA: AmmeMemoRadiSam system protein B [Candidatus Polarisedimenticolaceae bacterium]|nr:AmmeMemoRadiSam system protein B [Candidatus Polarisedimenticolaceae bacterium]